MIRMRKDREAELFKVFKEHNDRMVSGLRNIMVQKVDDEDERIARAVAERDREREVRIQITHYNVIFSSLLPEVLNIFVITYESLQEVERFRKERNEQQLKEIAKHRKEIVCIDKDKQNRHRWDYESHVSIS